MLTYSKRKSNDNHKTSDFDLKQRCIRDNTSSKNVVVIAFVTFVVFSRFADDRRLDKLKKFVSRKIFFNKIENLKTRRLEISLSRVIIVTVWIILRTNVDSLFVKKKFRIVKRRFNVNYSKRNKSYLNDNTLTISTLFVQLKVLLKSKTRHNYIVQNFAMQHDFFVVRVIFRDINIIDDIVLKMFFIYVVNVTTKNNLKRTHKKQSFFYQNESCWRKPDFENEVIEKN